MNRLLCFTLSLIMALSCLAGCSSGPQQYSQDDGRIHIVTTIFPIYDWCRNVMGDSSSDIELTLLLDKGVDMHSFQPGVDDILTISSCDLLIYGGGESDSWIDDALKDPVNPDIKSLNLLDSLGQDAREEELKEGMKADGQEDQESGSGYDEHVWLSLKNAEFFCGEITDLLSQLDEGNAASFEKNCQDYREKLEELEEAYTEAAGRASEKTLIVADRFPFLYLTEDCGLDYCAAFSGCTAETEVGFDTVIFLADRAGEVKAPVILTTESSDGRLAQTVADNVRGCRPEVMVLNSMQSVTEKQIKEGLTYTGVMESNLGVLKAALGEGSDEL